jgi:hypothetical protein
MTDDREHLAVTGFWGKLKNVKTTRNDPPIPEERRDVPPEDHRDIARKKRELRRLFPRGCFAMAPKQPSRGDAPQMSA